MKNYAETEENEKVNWKKELTKLVGETPLKKDLDRLKELGGTWDTCAIGQLSVVIPRTESGEPIDSILTTLGTAFSNSVENGEIENALDYLKMVDLQNKIILKEMETELKDDLNEFYKNSGIKLK